MAISNVLVLALSTTPPSITDGLNSSLTPLFDRVTQLLNDGWDVAQPWLTLIAALSLAWWWVSWRSGSRNAGPGE